MNKVYWFIRLYIPVWSLTGVILVTRLKLTVHVVLSILGLHIVLTKYGVAEDLQTDAEINTRYNSH